MECSQEDAFRNLKNKILSIIGGGDETISLIGYCCDVEGNLQYWENYLSISLVLREDDGVLFLRDRCHFVFGGDVCDRGEGDLRVLRAVTGLKERYPERVHLIMGNRDINKLRMPFELTESTLKSSLGNVYWAPKMLNTGHTAAEKLKWMLLNTLGCPLTFELRRRELATLSGADAAAVDDAAVVESFTGLVAPDGLLTKYLMGAELGVVIADVCFCHGALHVENLGKVPPGVGGAGRAAGGGDPSGVAADLTESLTGMQVLQGWRMCTGNVQEWFQQLNDFAHDEMRHYQSTCEEYVQRMCTGEFHRPSPLPSPPATPRLTANLSYSTAHTAHTTSVCSQDDADEEDMRSGGAYWALVGGYAHPQPGSRLLQYGMGWTPDKEKNPSLVYENWLNDKGEPIIPPPTVTEYLKRSGIRYITTGHQPHGDAPLVLSTDDVVYIAADTSYAVNVKWEGDGSGVLHGSHRHDGHSNHERSSFAPQYDRVMDAGVTRGCAVSEVCFEIEGGDAKQRDRVGTAFSHGVLSNRNKYAFPILHTRSDDCQAPPNLLSNQDINPEWWIKGRCMSPDCADSIMSTGETFSGCLYLASKSAKFSVTNKYFHCE